MSIGLDLGTQQFRSIRSVGEQLVARSCPAAFTMLSDTAAHRRLLQQSNTRFATCSNQLLIFGDAAVEWSAMLNLSLTPLLRSGRIPTSDAVSRQLLTLVLDAVLPAAEFPGSLCCMTLPGGGHDDRSKNLDVEFFQQLVSLRGYRPRLVTATQALALAEFNASSFTGIAITIGQTNCEFGIAHYGREIARCVVTSGLDSFEDAVRLGDENPAFLDQTGATSNSERDYVRFFSDVLAEARTQFEQDRTLKTLPQPLAVICTGGITAASSFAPLFQRVWDESNWPVATQPVRIATDVNFAVVRGCLIQAELDQPSERKSA